MDALTLDQFLVFISVVDEGSFAGAGRKLRRAQSAITYAIQKLEDQSGCVLFDRSTYRPNLTEAGRALLPHARRILIDLAHYRSLAQSLSAGVEAEVRLIVPNALPLAPVTAALRKLRSSYPSVCVRIETGSTATALHHIDRGIASLAIVYDSPHLPTWLIRSSCTTVRLRVVCAPDHPLAALPSPIPPEILAKHLQIVVGSPPDQDQAPDRGVVADNLWYVTDYGLKRRLILDGLGWGSLPENLVEDDLSSGCLRDLVPLTWDGSATLPKLNFVCAVHAPHVPGPAVRCLLEALTGQA